MRELIGLLIDPGRIFSSWALTPVRDRHEKLYGGPAYEEEKRGHIPGGG